MGNSGSRGGAPKGKKIIESKLAQAEKTGVLNLANQDLKPSSSVWDKLLSHGLTTRLKTLDISGNILKSMPAEIYDMELLKTLHVSRCNIQRIHDMSHMDRLTTLDLDNNDLEKESLAILPSSLVKLNLCNNHFMSIPILTDLIVLKELNLSGNRLTDTSGLGVLVSLVHLNLDGNTLEELSEDIASCTKLQHLSLKNNKLSGKAISREDSQSIPESIFILTALDNVDLSGNVMLSKAMVMEWRGIDAFIERRRKSKNKNLQGGAATDHSIFGDLT